MLALSVASASGVQAQRAPSSSCGPETGAGVRGLVLDDSTGLPIAGAPVVLLVSYCVARTDSTGRFTMNDARPGRDRIETNRPGYRQFTSQGIEIVAGDTIEVELRLRPGGPVEDCRADPECGRVLADAPAGMADADAFALAAFGTALATGWEVLMTDRPWYVCLEDASPAVLGEIRARYEWTVPSAECELPPQSVMTRPERQLRHVPTGRLAMRLDIRDPEETGPARRSAIVSYMVDRLWAELWACELERRERGWQPVVCVLIGQA